jgi:hypothetical protein
MLNDPKFKKKKKKLSSIAELCRGLIETEKSERYHLIDRLIHLVLTLPGSIVIHFFFFLDMSTQEGELGGFKLMSSAS